MVMNNLLLWDFDGVIIDSVDECLITSYNAYLQYIGAWNHLICKLDDIPMHHREDFYKTRKYVRPAGEYYILHKAIFDGLKIDTYVEFKALLEANYDAVFNFQDIFFSVRDAFRNSFQQSWFKLHRPYPGMCEKWQELGKYFDFYIVSNKDIKSISLILNHFNLPIQQEKIFSADMCLTKKRIIKNILKVTQNDVERMFFVDDNYQHLLDVRNVGIKLFYATWGYGEIQHGAGGNIIHLELNTFDTHLIKEGHDGKIR